MLGETPDTTRNFRFIEIMLKMKKSKHQNIIDTLHKGNFYVECPCCGEEIALKQTGLFDNDNFSENALEIYQQQLKLIRERKLELQKLKERGTSKSEPPVGARMQHSQRVGFSCSKYIVSGESPFLGFAVLRNLSITSGRFYNRFIILQILLGCNYDFENKNTAHIFIDVMKYYIVVS